METINVYQLIDEPTNVRTQGMSCIDLIVTDQPNMFVDYGVHPPLDPHCEHKIIFGKSTYRSPLLLLTRELYGTMLRLACR